MDGGSSTPGVYVLGSVGLQTPEGRIALSARRAQLLLTRLALSARSPVPVETLADALWGDELPATWYASLRNTTSALRARLVEALPDADLRHDGGAYTLALPAHIDVDLEQVRRLLSMASDATDMSVAERLTDQALRALRPGLATGLDMTWLDDARREVELLQRRATVLLAEVRLQAERPLAALAVAAQLVADDPIDERGYRLAMRASAQAGYRSEALRTYEDCRIVLRDELGVRPSDETEALYLSLLGDDGPAPSIPAPLDPGRGSTFVGRDAELALLASAWTDVRGGASRVVLVSGEAGMGKTRLVAALAAEVAESGGVVAYGRCDEDIAVPHRPFREALAARLDDAPAATELELVATAAELPTTAPTLLVLDDLHWAGSPTLAVLRHLARHPIPGLLLVGMFRPDEVTESALNGLVDSGDVRAVALAPLPTDAVMALSQAVARDQPSFDEAEQLVADTGGNPFFLTELLRLGLDDAVSLSTPELGGTPRLPEDVRGVIRRRVERLDDTTREVLDAAAVVGPEFALHVLFDAIDIDNAAVFDAVDAAAAAGLVRAVPNSIGDYAFVHSLARAAIYGDIASGRRARQHLGVATILERDPRFAADHPEVLAHHFASAAVLGCWPQAVEYSRLAADRAVSAHSHGDAAVFLGDALFALRVARDPDPGLRAELELALGLCLARIGDDRAAAVLTSAAATARDNEGAAAVADAVATIEAESIAIFDLDLASLRSLVD